MTLRFTRLTLTSHITFSVGWLGAVVVFLVLAITGLTSTDPQLARAAFMSMELCSWTVIVPLCLASLFSGVVQAMVTEWGLFRHYWIVVKLILTVAATILLLLHMEPISYMAGIASKPSFANTELPQLRIQLIADAGAALMLLLATTTISVYKPWGRIKFGTWKGGHISGTSTLRKRSWGFYVLIGMVALILAILIIHIFGGGMGGH